MFYYEKYQTYSVLVSQGCHTDYHKLAGLNQQKFILSQFWKLEVQSQQGCALSESSREESFLASSSFWWLQEFLSWQLQNSVSIISWPSSLCVCV